MKRFEVCYEDLPPVIVMAEDTAGAIMSAAKEWCVKFAVVAAHCDVLVMPMGVKYKCRGCSCEIPTEGWCQRCKQNMEIGRRDAAVYARRFKTDKRRGR